MFSPLHRYFILFCFILLCHRSFGTESRHHLRDEVGESSISGEILDNHVFKEYAAGLSLRNNIIKRDRVSADHIHEAMFAVKPKNLPILERILHDVSDPKSDRYGQHLTREEVEELTSNKESQLAILSFLEDAGAMTVSKSLYGEYITASAPISLWESVFKTEFFTFHHRESESESESDTKVMRAEHYSVPRKLHQHIEAVFNTIQMPTKIWGKPIIKRIQAPNNSTIHKLLAAGFIHPSKLNSFYKIDSNAGNSQSTQGIFSTIGQYLNEKDLTQFQIYNSIPIQAVATKVGGHIDTANTICKANADNCIEANLDIQYLTGISQVSPTTSWYTDLGNFSAWLSSIANIANPPLVMSISYGTIEKYLSKSELDAFNNQAIKLGSMGRTIVVASGDDGAAGYMARYDKTQCGYSPFFPASSPYVTSVGATQGVEYGTQEVACQSNAGGTITSGGGFSTYYPRPTWQTSAVQTYFSIATGAYAPVSGYAVNGRGFPDVSLAGSNFYMVIGGSWYSVAGTSASAPVVAGMFSLINAARLAQKKSSIGWLNPLLYAYSKSFINDITVGKNHCVADDAVAPTCCAQGYYTAPGWDPVTGLGSINFLNLKTVLLQAASAVKKTK